MDQTKKIKICLVIPSLEPGGMERVMSELANQFAKNDGIDLHIVLYGSNRKIFYALPENITIHKPNWKFDNSRRVTHALKTSWFLRKKITSLQPDTVLSFGELWNNIVLLSLLGTGIRVYVSDRSQPNKDLGWLQNGFRRWLYPHSAGVILQTEKAKTIYNKHYKNLNIEVIGNPIRAIINTDAGLVRQNQVLMVGRLVAGKNQERLIKIFARIDNKAWKLVLVGDGLPTQNIKEKLIALTVKLDVADKVVFAGAQLNVEQYYLASKIFAFTSSSEGFPNVVGEAMSAGLPVISYDCQAGPSDMINDSKNGFLVPVFDDLMFENRLKKLMDNEERCKQFSKQAQADIKKFSVEAISKQFFSFITSDL